MVSLPALQSFSSFCTKITHIIPEISCHWLVALTLAAASIAGLGEGENYGSALQRENPLRCAALEASLVHLLSFQLLSDSVIRIIRTETLWTLLLLSVKLTSERQIYNTLARQN